MKKKDSIFDLLTDDERRLWQMCKNKGSINSDTAPSRHKYDRAGNRVLWKLTPLDVRILLEQAGISVWDWGKGKGKYELARIEDVGHYEMGNCRFLTHRENILERDSSYAGNAVKEWHRKNPGVAAERAREWHRKNPGLIAEINKEHIKKLHSNKDPVTGKFVKWEQ